MNSARWPRPRAGSARPGLRSRCGDRRRSPPTAPEELDDPLLRARWSKAEELLAKRSASAEGERGALETFNDAVLGAFMALNDPVPAQTEEEAIALVKRGLA